MSETGTGSRVDGIVLALAPDSTEPPFRQLKGQIVEAIRRGTLTPGTRMPAIRTMATEVGIAARTAAKVYSELEEAGMLEGRGRSGTFVTTPDLTSAVLTRAAEEFAERAVDSGFTLNEAITAVRVAYSHLD